MPTTNATAAKLAVIEALREESGSGLLGDVEVRYAFQGSDVPRRLIYGGGWRFEQEDAVEEPGVLRQEVVSVSLYVRVVKTPACPVEETDAEAAAIGDLIGTVFAARPKLAGDLTYLGIASGQGDYSDNGTETISIHAYQVRVGGWLTWG